MKATSITVFAFGCLAIACSQTSDSVPTKTIVGAYAIENSFEVPNTSTGEILGVGKIRDTIIIKEKMNGFDVVNNKWRSNDYDMKGWQNLEHSENRPMSTYGVTYDPTDSSLNSNPLGLMPSLFFDFKKRMLYKGKDRNRPYVKVISDR